MSEDDSGQRLYEQYRHHMRYAGDHPPFMMLDVSERGAWADLEHAIAQALRDEYARRDTVTVRIGPEKGSHDPFPTGGRAR